MKEVEQETPVVKKESATEDAPQTEPEAKSDDTADQNKEEKLVTTKDFSLKIL